MTICIAAIAEENKIVAITDKMVTLAYPVATAYEISNNTKAIKLNDKAVGLFSGNVINANEILNRAKLIIEPKHGVLEIANIINTTYKEFWDEKISNYLTLRYNLDLKMFMHNHGKFDVDFVKNITGIIQKFQIDVEILIAGVDDKPGIYRINNEGSVVTESMGYAAIGSGREHAILSLIESKQNHTIALEESLYNLIEAKKRAEYDPGVGEECDIVLLKPGFTRLEESVVDDVLNHFNKSRKLMSKNKDNCSLKIKEVLS